MFVVVYLIDSQTHIIIPEKWICDLNEENLKNNGANSFRKHLVFWSNLAVDENGVPNPSHEPNFRLHVTAAYPPLNGMFETCYYGRIKHFFSK